MPGTSSLSPGVTVISASPREMVPLSAASAVSSCFLPSGEVRTGTTVPSMVLVGCAESRTESIELSRTKCWGSFIARVPPTLFDFGRKSAKAAMSAAASCPALKKVPLAGVPEQSAPSARSVSSSWGSCGLFFGSRPTVNSRMPEFRSMDRAPPGRQMSATRSGVSPASLVIMPSVKNRTAWQPLAFPSRVGASENSPSAPERASPYFVHPSLLRSLMPLSCRSRPSASSRTLVQLP